MNPLLHDSPHIVHLLGHTQKHALVLEFVDQNLNHLINSRQESDCPFYPIEAVELMLQISKAMRHLHSPNINVVHRDLKPSNVLVKPRRRSGGFLIKLADFGISRKNFQTLETKTDYKGTLVYMAPEMKAEAGKYSRKVDVYSFGLICMEILGEQLPTQYEIEKEAGFEMEAYYVRMGLPKDIPNRLKSLILSCMKYDAENRPSFQEICNSLWLVKEEILIGDVAAMKLNLTLSLPEGIQVASSSGSSAIATSSEFRMLTHGMQVRFQHVQTETYIQAQNGDIGLDIGVSKNPGLQETFKLWKTVRIDNRPMKFRTFIRVLDHHIIQAKFGGGYGLHAHGNNEGTHETFVITVKPNTDPSARNARVVIQAYEGGQYLQVLNNEVAATFVDDPKWTEITSAMFDIHIVADKLSEMVI